MKKSNFVAMILGTIGMVFFALGMCMALIEEWGMFRQGIVAGVVGLVILLITLIVWRRMEGKEPIKLSGKTVGTVVLAIFGALLLGVGMCFSMVFGKMFLGVVIGVVGIVALLMLIPLTKGLK
jgi:hypothetical protein